jgi:hypothetical protein
VSIDARIASVVRRQDGSGELHIVDRPADSVSRQGIAGQSVLRFDHSDPCVLALAGRNVWGPSSCILLGERSIADRRGYTRIEWKTPDAIHRAIAATFPPITGRLNYLRKWFRARILRRPDAVCALSVGKGLADYHDYPDSVEGQPWHFHELTCKRCGKRFGI